MSDAPYWLRTSGDDLTPRPALGGDRDVDVAVVGAGYTGLWTAWYLLAADPSVRVLVVEAEIAGFGASGRNGAWLAPGIAVTPSELARRYGREAARATVLAMRDTVDEVARVCAATGIDAQLRRGGILRIARGAHEVPALRAGRDAMAALDLADGLEVLDAAEVAARVRVRDARGALSDPYGAVVHPGRLVRGLARSVEQAGGEVVEGTRVTAVHPGEGTRRPRLTTDGGTVTADAVVVAGEAWSSQLPGRRRDVLPLYSLVVLTEPVDDATWDEIGWADHACLSSHRLTVDYLSRTTDGRVLFGGRGAPYHYGSRIAPAFDRHAATHGRLAEHLADWFPALRGTAIAQAWGGPLGMPRDWLPTFRHDPSTGLAAAFGYTGQGVATANLAGRVLADLLHTGDTPHRELPMVGHRSRRWEPEPLRWLGARYLQTALARADARAERTGRPPSDRSLAARLMRH
ncbi:FAD-dependent oxidoreductase [Nitriliruptoraceae bacterium ZYF776]|nr:FAD-dependent oxidoreductase [Profundirhabdus halotolerans]